MHLGDIEVRFLRGGEFRLDGGAMFGVVPKVLWEKKAPPDDRNRIRLACNSLLLRTSGHKVLVETGNGTKWDGKLRDIYAIDAGDPLGEALAQEGLEPEEISLVINTHLHFDHAGGNTRFSGGCAVPAFPNAMYVLQRGELEHAERPSERDRASYLPENFVPVTQARQWQLLAGDTDLIPGVSLIKIPGHNRDIQCVKISGGGKTICFIADLFPTRHHLSLPWIMAYDLYPMQTLETKRKWLADIIGNGWIVVFGHDPDVPAAVLAQRDGRIEYEPVDLNR